MGLGRFFRQIGEVRSLADASVVARVVPQRAEYVTAGLMLPLLDAAAFNHGGPGGGAYGRDLGCVADQGAGAQQVGFLVLVGGRLCVLGEAGERWSVPVASVVALDAHRRSGFVVFVGDGSGLAVSTQTPVPVPGDGGCRTVPRIMNAFSGWDEVLAPFGVETYW